MESKALRCYMSIITVLVFHCRTLVFPWLVPCPVCVVPASANCGRDDDEATESVLE